MRAVCTTHLNMLSSAAHMAVLGKNTPNGCARQGSLQAFQAIAQVSFHHIVICPMGYARPRAAGCLILPLKGHTLLSSAKAVQCIVAALGFRFHPPASRVSDPIGQTPLTRMQAVPPYAERDLKAASSLFHQEDSRV